MSLWVWLGVALLGGLGAVIRFRLDSAIAQHTGRGLPFGTLTINLSGALALGLLTGLTLSGDLLILAGSATLGSYTTFSTWMLESHRLAEDGDPRAAAVNLVASLIAGFAAALLGRAIGARL